MDELEALRSANARERAARAETERILEEKSAALHHANTALQAAKEALVRRADAADEGLRASLQRLRLVLRASEAGALEWEPSGGVHIDSRLCSMLGLGHDGRSMRLEEWLAQIQESERGAFRAELGRAERGEGFDREFRTADGARVLAVQGRLLDEPGRGGVVVYALVRDVTRRRAFEIDQRRLATHAARRERLVMLGELASTIAHEINQPLGSIVNYASAASRMLSRTASPAPELIRALNEIGELARGASQTIRGVRGMIVSPGEGFEEVDASLILDAAVATVRPDAEDAGVGIEICTDDAVLSCNRVLLEHAVSNLLRNAVETLAHWPGERSVRLGAHAGADSIRFRVDDTGPGLGGLDSDEVFEPLITGRAGGSGMGLALCRTVAEQHSGWARCTPNPAHATGLRFEIEIPWEGACFRSST